MNHATDAKRLLTTFCVNGDEKQRARVAELVVDHIIAAAVEAVEAKQHSPGCDEAPAIDPDMPRRFRWQDNGELKYGCFFPQWDVFSTGLTRVGKPNGPLEWIDPEPESP